MDAVGLVLFLVAVTLVGVAVIAYRVGFLRGEAETLYQRQRIAVTGSDQPMEPATLPPWRRVAGWAAYLFSALLLCLFLTIAYRHAYSWRWTYLMAAWLLWFAIFLGGIWLAEWCWKPSRAAGTVEEPPQDPRYSRRRHAAEGAREGGPVPGQRGARGKSPPDLIFEALCLRYRATTNVSKAMTRQELEAATGLPADVVTGALQALVGPNASQSLFVRFVEGDPDQITIGPGWFGRCEDMGKDT